jgi:DNA polymerase
MSIITVDLETYYSKQYSLSLRDMTTEQYINHPDFEVIGIAIKIDDGPSVWYPGVESHGRLASINWADHALLCHNAMFDGAILAWKFGIIPGMYLDTMLMGRAIHGLNQSVSLKSLTALHGVGEKGEEIINAMGLRLRDFNPDSLLRYGAYCRNDADLTFALFNKLTPGFPEDELSLIDMTLRMYTQPVFRLDDNLLVERAELLHEQKANMLASLIDVMDCRAADDPPEMVKKNLNSSERFAGFLRNEGVEPPMKLNPKNKRIYAFAKTDEEFLALQEHENPRVQTLCAVRLGAKSTIEETRIERFIEIGKRNGGLLPIPLKYMAAGPFRWAGMDGINMQNLPSRDKDKKTLKNAVLAPLGHYVVNADSSQVEARVAAWWAGQDDLVQAFREGRDVYSEFATDVYGYPVSKKTPDERFVGKESILSLQFGVGEERLQQALKIKGGINLDLDMCAVIKHLYRSKNYKIPERWRECAQALKDMMDPDMTPYQLGDRGGVLVYPGAVRMPNGLFMHYPGLRINELSDLVYKTRRGEERIHGPKLFQNIIQCLARSVVSKQMLAIHKRYPVRLTVHDSAVLVVPEEALAEALESITITMSTPPSWAMGLPVTCEVKHGRSYGDC